MEDGSEHNWNKPYGLQCKKKKDYNKGYAYETLMICKKYGDEVLLGLTDT